MHGVTLPFALRSEAAWTAALAVAVAYGERNRL